MAATRYNLTGTFGMPFSRKLSVQLKSGVIVNATFPTRVFRRHDETATAVVEANTAIVDEEASIVEMTISAVEMAKLDPDLIYAYQIDGQAQDNYIEPIAHGRFYVNPRYSEGGGTA